MAVSSARPTTMPIIRATTTSADAVPWAWSGASARAALLTGARARPMPIPTATRTAVVGQRVNEDWFHVDDDGDECHTDERADCERDSTPAPDDAARHEWVGGGVMAPQVESGGACCEGQERMAERTDDLLVWVGGREGEDDQAKRRAEQEGTEQVGAPQDRPPVRHREGSRGEQQRGGDESDRGDRS